MRIDITFPSPVDCLMFPYLLIMWKESLPPCDFTTFLYYIVARLGRPPAAIVTALCLTVCDSLCKINRLLVEGRPNGGRWRGVRVEGWKGVRVEWLGEGKEDEDIGEDKEGIKMAQWGERMETRVRFREIKR